MFCKQNKRDNSAVGISQLYIKSTIIEINYYFPYVKLRGNFISKIILHVFLKQLITLNILKLN